MAKTAELDVDLVNGLKAAKSKLELISPSFSQGTQLTA